MLDEREVWHIAESVGKWASGFGGTPPPQALKSTNRLWASAAALHVWLRARTSGRKRAS